MYSIPYDAKIHGIYSNKDLTFFVMDLLGPSLHDVFRKHQRKLPMIRIINYAKQMVELLRIIHRINFIHRDIKPENFIFTDKKENQLKLVDFGLSKKMPLLNQKCKVRQTSKIIGTLRYASINAHEGKILGRKDDVQSLAYVIIYLMKGSLPWQGMRAKTDNEKHDMVYKIKKSISTGDLCEGLPQAVQRLVNYVRDEDLFDKDQCYNQLTDYLNECLEESISQTQKNQPTNLWDLQNYQLTSSIKTLDPLETQVPTPLTVQKKTSSNQAPDTSDQQFKDSVSNMTTSIKKKPIKIPSIKKQFTLNYDSDSELSPQIQKKHKKSYFIDDDEDE